MRHGLYDCGFASVNMPSWRNGLNVALVDANDTDHGINSLMRAPSSLLLMIEILHDIYTCMYICPILAEVLYFWHMRSI